MAKFFKFCITGKLVVDIQAPDEIIEKIRSQFGEKTLDGEYDGHIFVGDGWDFNKLLAEWNKIPDERH